MAPHSSALKFTTSGSPVMPKRKQSLYSRRQKYNYTRYICCDENFASLNAKFVFLYIRQPISNGLTCFLMLHTAILKSEKVENVEAASYRCRGFICKKVPVRQPITSCKYCYGVWESAA